MSHAQIASTGSAASVEDADTVSLMLSSPLFTLSIQSLFRLQDVHNVHSIQEAYHNTEKRAISVGEAAFV